MREKIQKFMQGRYGSDQFTRFLVWLSLGLLIVSMFISPIWNGVLSSILWYLGVIALIYSIFRSLSKSIYKRQDENRRYLGLTWRVKGAFRRAKQWFKDRKDYKYFKCPACKSAMRVPKHKGKVQITCKKCGEKFTGKT